MPLDSSARFTEANRNQSSQPKRPRDVPFVPSPNVVVDAMLKLADLKKTDILYDLGCGDGQIVIAAARDYGARGVGIDIDPERVREATANAKTAGVEDLVKFEENDLFETDIHTASVVTLYLGADMNLRLLPKLLRDLKPGARVVSHEFEMDGWGGDMLYAWMLQLALGAHNLDSDVDGWKPDKVQAVDDGKRLRDIYLWTIPQNKYVAEPIEMTRLEAALVEVAAFLDQSGFAYMLVGDLAIGAWGDPRTASGVDVSVPVSRTASGVDVSVWVSPENLDEAIRTIARQFRAAPDMLAFAHRSRLFRVTTTNGIPANIAFAGVVDEREFLSRTRTKRIAGADIRLVRIEDLVYLKLMSTRRTEITDGFRLIRRFHKSLDRIYLELLIQGVSNALAHRHIINFIEDWLPATEDGGSFATG